MKLTIFLVIALTTLAIALLFADKIIFEMCGLRLSTFIWDRLWVKGKDPEEPM